MKKFLKTFGLILMVINVLCAIGVTIGAAEILKSFSAGGLTLIISIYVVLFFGGLLLFKIGRKTEKGASPDSNDIEAKDVNKDKASAKTESGSGGKAPESEKKNEQKSYNPLAKGEGKQGVTDKPAGNDGMSLETFVKSLYDRLEGQPEKRAKLICIMDNAINEMHNNGIFYMLPQDVQAKVHSADPGERVVTKTSIAKSYAYENFVKSSELKILDDGDPAHSIDVRYDRRFINSILLCIQGGLEGLFLSGIYKECKDGVMQYFVHTDAKGDDYNSFCSKLSELNALYDSFKINAGSLK